MNSLNADAADQIAVVGMAGRFPGAKNIEAFWRNLQQGVESIVFFKDEELESLNLDAALLGDPSYIKARAILDDAESFDAGFFGFKPKEAELTDPQQRIFLECAWEALENAGYDPENYPGAIAVYAGAGSNTYLLNHLYPNHTAYELSSLAAMIGNDKDFLATRVSYKLNLRGPSVSVQTACSTSLVAVSMACNSLLSYQCDMALAGGVAVSFPQRRGYLYQEGGILSGDGHVRAFDERAQGMLAGHGAGIVVLKRLSEALADGDTIWAVIKGTAMNNDGAQKVGYTAPSVDGQAEVIALAQALADVTPDTISYVEAHGTGTPLGDPIEIAGLTQAFRLGTEAKNFCAIGSVKTNVGHLDIAAGVTGLIKTVLALRHKQLPPSLNFERPNPKIDFANSPFYVNTELREWETAGTPRRAGVSSFGIGGTNAHVVVEEAPVVASSSPARPWQLLTLSAKTATALDTATTNLAEHLAQHPELNLADAAYTLQLGRRGFQHRRIVVCRDHADAISLLQTPDANRVVSQTLNSTQTAVSFMFPGQGAQFINMGRELYETEPVYRQHIDSCAELLLPELGLDLRSVLYPDADQAETAQQQLTQTGITQPALFAVEYATAQLWMAWGITPQALIGHSIGEYVAACLAGVFSLPEALALVAARARLMQALPAGAMLAIRLPEQEVVPLLGNGIALAAVNSPALCVVSGAHAAIEALQQQLTEHEIGQRRLHTSHAFHSAMMEPMLAAFDEQLTKVKLRAPQIPYISNVTGTWITAAQATDPHYWTMHIRQTVRFSDGLQALFSDRNSVLLEVGPGQTLTTLARQHSAKSGAQLIVASGYPVQEPGSDRAALLTALGRLWLAGVTIDWRLVHQPEQRQRVPLPAYPFERRRYFVEVPALAKNMTAQVLNNKSVDCVTRFTQQADRAVRNEKDKEITMADAQVVTPSNSSGRQARLVPQLQSLLSELSGMDLASVSTTTTFLEMGFDSLFLTQLSQALQKKFGIKVAFRQLLGESATLTSLATYIDQQLPAEAFQEAPHQPSAVAGNIESVSAQTASLLMPAPDSVQTNTSTPAAASVLERVIAQQLQLMAQQLAQLRTSAAPASVAAASLPAPHGEWSMTGVAHDNVTQQTVKKDEVKAFGPYKPIVKGASGGLTGQQQAHLNELVARYTQRTAESKRYTQEHRPHLTDPRAVSGFRLLWKEMVYPVVAARSSGSKIWDVDGNEYIDLTMGFGVNLFGHSPPFVITALEEQLKLGIEIGPTSPLTGQVAQLLCELTGMERAIFCNTGSEAVMAALRAARTVSGRDKIALFSGAYHGIFDEVLVRGHATADGKPHSLPIAPGIPEHMVQDVLVLEYGTPAALQMLKAHGHELAAVIVESVQSRRPDLQPREFLHELRRITQQTGTALIFDEVITGFRAHPQGAQGWFGVQADLATYGKVIGGGMPIGAVAGKAAYLDVFDGGAWQYGDNSFPEVGVTFFAGTFVRHPLALAAAWAVLNHLKSSGPELQQRLNQRTTEFINDLNSFFQAQQAPVRIAHFSSLFYISFEGEQKYASLLFYHLREKGVHVWEGRPCFLSTAHSDADIVRITQAFKDSVMALQDGGFFPPAPAPRGGLAVPDHAADATPAQASASTPSAPTSVALTEAQRELWVAAQMSTEGSRAYNDCLTLALHGPLNKAALYKALQNLVARHEALRTTFSAAGDVQHIATHGQLELHGVDLSNVAASQREHALHAHLQTGAQREFDLVHGPLVRAELVTLEPKHHVLVVTAHHIVCDGWSLGVLFRELSELYNAAHENRSAALPPALAFSTYAAWQERPEQVEARRRAEDYWVQQYAEPAPALDLPTDRPRPAQRSYRGARHVARLDAALYAQLKRAGAQQGATLFTVLLTAYMTWLQRLTGQDDVVIGVPAAGQSLIEGGEHLLGHCVNFLPLRQRLDMTANFNDALRAVQDNVLETYEHQQCTYGSLIRRLALPHDPSRAPLVSATFNIDRRIDGLDYAGLRAQLRGHSKQFINFDLKLNAVETGEGMELEWDYNTALFDATTIERLSGHYATLLQGILADSTQPLAALALLTQAEQAVLTAPAPYIPAPVDTVITRFEAQVALTPDALAVEAPDGTLTYAALNVQANRLAHALRALGAGPETRVGLFAERGVGLLGGLWGILKAGAAYVPLDPQAPPARLRTIAADAGLLAVVSPSVFPDVSDPDLDLPVLCADDATLAAQPAHNPDAPPRPGDLAYVLYTSGSSGAPKGVMIEHGALMHLHQALADTVYSDLAQQAPARPLRVSLNGPLYFDTSVKQWLQLLSGHTLCLVPEDCRPDGAALLAYLANQRVDVLDTTPTQLTLLAQAGLLASHAYRPACLLIGGEALAPSLWAAIAACPEWAAYNLYGPTECTVDATLARLTPGGTPHLGQALPHVGLRILDAQRQPVPVGVAGELYIGGAGVGRGYLNRPDLTQARFLPDPNGADPQARLYQTGDRVRRRADGTLDYLGRLDGQVKLRGYRIELGEIEALLQTHPQVASAAVSVREDIPGDARMVAYIVARDSNSPDEASLRTHLSTHLPDYLLPSAYVTLTQLPLTRHGKLDRHALPAPPVEATVTPAPDAAPEGPVEQVVAKLYAQVLGRGQLDRHSSFFALGGHSLLAIQVLARLREALDVSVPVRTLFEAPTVSALSARLTATATDPARLAARARLYNEVAQLSPEAVRAQLARRRATKQAGGE